MSPSARLRHQRLLFRLAVALDAAVPAGLEVLAAINVRVGPGKILIPDLAVVSAPGLDVTVCAAADVVLIVEITSPGYAVVDRAVKPQLYAQAGIPHYLRVELRPVGPCAVVYRREWGLLRRGSARRPGPPARAHRTDLRHPGHRDPRRPTHLPAGGLPFGAELSLPRAQFGSK